MKKRIIIAACGAVIFFVGWAFGQAPSFDAAHWTQLGKADDYARLMYLKGYLRGYSDGDGAMERIAMMFVKKDQLNSMDAPTKKIVLAQTQRVGEIVGLPVRALQLDTGPTVGKIEETISTFYDDYRNAPVCWNEAVQFSIWSLSGNPPSDDEVSSARKSGAESGCN
jgi:hypothetical protein